jgi:hypothetical protein
MTTAYSRNVSDLWANQTSMQRATRTVPTSDSDPDKDDLREQVTPYAAQLGYGSARSQLASDVEPALAGAAAKMNQAANDALSPLADVLGHALGG